MDIINHLKNFKVIITVLLFISNCYSQSFPQVIPPSPESKEFVKYESFEVSKYNGLASISIPLYSINFDGIELPITLQYHASGIKIGQTNGDVGVGWLFSPGYRISRTVNGYPDDETTKPTDYLNKLHSFEYPGPEKDKYLSRFLPTNYLTQPFRGGQSKLDGEYDIFNFNLINEAGSFIISDRINNSITTLNQSNIKFNYFGSQEITGFNATDEIGTNYFFGNFYSMDYENIFELSTSWGNTKTAWALTDIISKNGDRLHFDYDVHSTGGWQYYNRNFSFTEGIPDKIESHYQLTEGESRDYVTFFLKEILGDNVSIKIERNNTNQIEYLKIYGPENEIIKEFRFYYTHGAHVFLDSLVSFDKDGLPIKRYNFEYYHKETPKTNLSHDQWGYYMDSGFFGQAYNHLFHDKFMDDLIFMNNYSEQPLSIILDQGARRDDLTSSSIPSHYSLKKIMYPTGGSSEYIYEHNSFKEGGDVIKGGGIRIKKIIKRDGGNGKLVREFKYGRDENGYGYKTVPINHKLFTNEGVNFLYDYDRPLPQRHITYSTMLQGDLDIGGWLSSNVVYPEVTEYYGELNSSQSNCDCAGKIIYEYDLNYTYSGTNLKNLGEFYSPDDGWEVHYSYFPYSPFYITRYFPSNKPLLKTRLFYKLKDSSNYNLVEKDSFNYSIGYSTFKGLKVRPFATTNDYREYELRYYKTISSFFRYDEYSILSGKVLKNQAINIKYYDDHSVSAITDYGYNSLNLLNKEELTNSLNEKVASKTYYPNDIKSTSSLAGGNLTSTEYAAIDKLKAVRANGSDGLHQTALPVQTETYVNGARMSIQRTTYKDWGNNLVLPEKVLISKGNEALEARLEYIRYDSYGNPTEVKQINGTTITYLWGYGGKYPIAKVENATYVEIAAALGVSVAALEAFNEGNLSQLDNLRELLPKAQVTTYTYEPLVGMRTMTDPRGKTTHYEYDDFNRLKTTKDDNLDLLSDFRYHYKDQ
ncbi:RHS repeat protein [Galbibacter sp. BG1]|uniref:RHS repeat domain-containing protein n=1 Tax=Galbibacter sp. BG1 TaxID=1170699 RepID=UPI0015C1883C|nr:RHS repeat domain-containing protein [Galbibacter sp. BG1]QLE02018.1 RHS repeat protein [Galbibacter sp. BG1]